MSRNTGKHDADISSEHECMCILQDSGSSLDQTVVRCSNIIMFQNTRIV